MADGMRQEHDLDPNLQRRWADAERRLYPIAVVDDRRYVQLVETVQAAAELLQVHDTAGELADAWGQAPAIAAEAARRVGIEPAAAEVDIIAGAAFALRHREVTAAAAEAAARDRIAAATAAGQEWVVLVDRHAPGTHHHVELHLPDGLGLYTYAEPAVDDDGTVFGVDVLLLDAATGSHSDARPLWQAVCASADAWERTIQEARTRIEAGDAFTP